MTETTGESRNEGLYPGLFTENRFSETRGALVSVSELSVDKLETGTVSTYTGALVRLH